MLTGIRWGVVALDRMDVISLLIVSFPESILVAVLGLMLVGVRPRGQDLMAIGAFQAGIAYLVRLTPVPFGLHSLLMVAVFIVILRLVLRLDWKLVAVAGLLGITIYVAVETVISSLLLYLTGLSLAYVLETPALRFLFFLPEALLLGVLIWACIRFDFRLLGPPPGFPAEDKDWQTLNRSYYLLYLLAVLPVSF